MCDLVAELLAERADMIGALAWATRASSCAWAGSPGPVASAGDADTSEPEAGPPTRRRQAPLRCRRCRPRDRAELRLLLSLRFRIRNDIGLPEDAYDRLLDELPSEPGAISGSIGRDDQRVGRLVQIHPDRVPVGDLPGQQFPGQLIADRRLDQPAQRPCPVHGVEAGHGQPFAGRGRDLERQPAVGEPPRQPGNLQVDDLVEVLGGQRVEDDDVVEPVEELRLERRPDHAHHGVPLGGLVERRVGDVRPSRGSR